MGVYYFRLFIQTERILGKLFKNPYLHAIKYEINFDQLHGVLSD